MASNATAAQHSPKLRLSLSQQVPDLAEPRREQQHESDHREQGDDPKRPPHGAGAAGTRRQRDIRRVVDRLDVEARLSTPALLPESPSLRIPVMASLERLFAKRSRRSNGADQADDLPREEAGPVVAMRSALDAVVPAPRVSVAGRRTVRPRRARAALPGPDDPAPDARHEPDLRAVHAVVAAADVTVGRASSRHNAIRIDRESRDATLPHRDEPVPLSRESATGSART